MRERAAHFFSKPILVAPNALYAQSVENQAAVARVGNHKLSVVIPGRVDRRRRVYTWIDALPSQAAQIAHVVLLGSVQSTEDRALVEHLQARGFEQPVLQHSGFIEQRMFDQYIRGADILFVPLAPLDSADRSIDRNLGAFFDAVRYAKPLIVPAHVPVAPELADMVVQVSSDDELISLLQLYARRPELLAAVQERAVRCAEMFSIDRLTYFREIERLNDAVRQARC